MAPTTHSPKRSPQGVAKATHHNPAGRSPRTSNKAVSLGSLNADRKRRAASVSSVSSVSSIGELSDDANDSEDDDADDEEEQPAVRGPSYGRRDRAHKTGVKQKKTKKMKFSDDDGYDGQRSSDDNNESDESSDDVYAAVDYISDGSDDEEQDVEKLEELLIVESENENPVGGILAAPGADAWAGPNVFDDHMILSAASFFDEEQLYTAMEAFGETDMASETAIETPVARRVHFEEDSDSSSDSDSHTEDEIPSDFLQQDSLDPQLRRMIDNDNENLSRRRRQSEEMYAESDYGHSNIYHVESDAISDGSESSGYESMHAAGQPRTFHLLTRLKPMMARLQMKISLLLPPSLIPDLSCVVILRPRWRPQAMRRAKPLLVGEDLSWGHLSPILINLLHLSTALASTL